MIGKGLIRSAGADEWWQPGGVAAYAAWDSVGAASKAASLLDLTGNGRNITETGTVSWAGGVGWSGFTTSNYLRSGITPTPGVWSFFIRLNSALGGVNFHHFGYGNGTTLLALTTFSSGSVNTLWRYGDTNTGLTKTSSPAEGVFGFADQEVYLDGTSLGTITDTAPSTAIELWIGVLNGSGTPQSPTNANVQAFAIFDSKLSAGDAATLSTSMAGL